MKKTQTKILDAIDQIELKQKVETLQEVVDAQAIEIKNLSKRLRAEIEQRKLVENKLSSAEVQMRAIFEAMNDIVLVVNTLDDQLAGVEVLPSQLFQSAADLADVTVSEFFEDKQLDWLDKVLQVIETQSPLTFEYSLCWQEKTYWFSANISPYSKDKAIWVARDVSGRKCVELALQEVLQQEHLKATQLELTLQQLRATQSQLVLQEKMASLGHLVAGIAHEINNPTNFIYGNIQPATDYALDVLHLLKLYQKNYPTPVEELTESLENIDLDFIISDFPKTLKSIKEGASRITKIVTSLRHFCHIDEAKYKEVNIHEGIDNTLLILQHRLKARQGQPGIEVIKDYGKIPLMECYPGQLNQVFLNLLSNSIDAIDELMEKQQDRSKPVLRPQIRVKTYVKDSTLIISIADTGKGIEIENIPAIFNPFFTTKPPGKGTGLGLSISYQIIVDKHGGQITCNSKIDMGTEFVIELPLKHDKKDL